MRCSQTQCDGVLSPYLQKVRFKRVLPYIVGKRILDVGCSCGEILRHLSKGIDYIGIEGDPAYYSCARRLNPGYQFINIYINGENSKNLNIPERDTILMLATLEHLENPLDILRNLKSYLSRHGRIIITTPADYARYILKIGATFRICGSGIYEHKDYFSKKRLLAICSGAGLGIIHYSKFGLNQLVVLEA